MNSPETILDAKNGKLVSCNNCSFLLYDPDAE